MPILLEMRVFGESTALWGGEFAQSKPVFNRARSIGRCFFRQRLRLENRTTAGEAKKQKSRKTPFKAGTGVWKQYRGDGVLEVDF